MMVILRHEPVGSQARWQKMPRRTEETARFHGVDWAFSNFIRQCIILYANVYCDFQRATMGENFRALTTA